MNRRTLLGAALLVPLIASGCAPTEPARPEYELVISATSWGYGEDGLHTTDRQYAFDVSPNSSFSIPGFIEDQLTFTVTEIRDGEVKFTTSEPLAPGGDSSGHDYQNTRTHWRATLSTPASFATPSEDAGVTYEVHLERTGG